ncbi:MAG: hypothetical protein ACTXOO_05535 [Sodalis sp. (in: enterobacteria)]
MHQVSPVWIVDTPHHTPRLDAGNQSKYNSLGGAEVGIAKKLLH